MWQVIYIIAFAVLAILAIANLVRNLILLGSNARNSQSPNAYNNDNRRPVPHPELLDQDGQVIREPLLVMRSISVKDAREQLDALYNSDDSSDDLKPGQGA
ncbi:MAG: hypothetical protein RLZZ597_3772 [Cyanobacteriota bacterium]|jgi:hypothetical protein